MRQTPEKIVLEVEKAISGKRDVISRILMALLADGHILMDDVPGVGKTTLALALSRAVGLSFQRVQFTPDVLPSDLVGFTMYDKNSGEFLYRPGALNGANLLLGDEINRAASRTQSALLEAMEEKQVTVDGRTYPLEEPFLVIATQNSVGAAGTQTLPYAQMDRFLVRLTVGYPDLEAQKALLAARQGVNPLTNVEQVVSRDDFLAMRREAAAVTARDAVLDYIARLSVASREDEALSVGISPRGAIYLDRMAKAYAFVQGRDYVTGADVQAVYMDVCAHRVLLTDAARAAGRTERDALQGILRRVPDPDRHGLAGFFRR